MMASHGLAASSGMNAGIELQGRTGEKRSQLLRPFPTRLPSRLAPCSSVLPVLVVSPQRNRTRLLPPLPVLFMPVVVVEDAGDAAAGVFLEDDPRWAAAGVEVGGWVFRQ